MSGAWAKGASKAVSAAPPPGAMQATPGRSGGGGGGASGGRGGGGGGRRSGGGGGGGRHSGGRKPRGGNSNNNSNFNGHNNNNNNNNSSEGRGGGGGRGGRGGRNNNQNHGRRHSSGRGGREGGENRRISHKDVQLLEETGVGLNNEQRKVIRIAANEFVRQRLQYIDPIDETSCPNKLCLWTDEKRVEIIQSLCSKVMELGDVTHKKNSKPRHDTAPPLEECAPLAVNEDTRWKSKAMEQKSSLITEVASAPETTEEIVNKARLILNKISWTTIEPLTKQFVEVTNLAENEEVRSQVITMIVHKAQTEPHFGPMYAHLCGSISKDIKTFKKQLVTECQEQFVTETADKIEEATKDKTDPEEIEYISSLIRKNYIGHMKFLGELYLQSVIKISVMLECLEKLLHDEEHEESLECYCNLLSTMGSKMEYHAKQMGKDYDWTKVEKLAKNPNISIRIKFMLQDLMDLRARGWVKRRQEETAKTIQDIHNEAAAEQQAQTRRVSSSSNLRRSSSVAGTETSSDSFVPVTRGSFRKVNSRGNVQLPSPVVKKGFVQPLRRAVSQPTNMSSYGGGGSSLARAAANIGGSGSGTKTTVAILEDLEHSQNKQENEEKSNRSKPPTLDDCEHKIKGVLKDFFISGDMADAMLSVDEIVQVGVDGSFERSAKIIEASTLMVMEMKSEDVTKMLTVMTKAMGDNKVDTGAIANGLRDPLEFARDIALDAPYAGIHVAQIIAKCLEMNALQLSFLKSAPEEFLENGKPAEMATKVLRLRGGDPSEEELEVLGALMTDADKEAYKGASDMFASAPNEKLLRF
eukprot:Nitzschia sp. Nitz4//scaffold149_size55946//51987//54625//NITZ4_006605-RA/size55946-augustus-gene-0.69-mRNA-1//1//CDS//3329536842//2927//frame0